jgi:hypothetical protein
MGDFRTLGVLWEALFTLKSLAEPTRLLSYALACKSKCNWKPSVQQERFSTLSGCFARSSSYNRSLRA